MLDCHKSKSRLPGHPLLHLRDLCRKSFHKECRISRGFSGPLQHCRLARENLVERTLHEQHAVTKGTVGRKFPQQDMDDFDRVTLCTFKPATVESQLFHCLELEVAARIIFVRLTN